MESAAPTIAVAEPVRRFQDSLDDLRLRQLYGYWRSKLAGRSMPRRTDIDPAEIPKLLPHIMITEMLDGGTRYRYRLSGTAVTEAFGRELTGLFVDEVMTGAYRAFLERLYRTVYLNRRCIFSESRYAGDKESGLMTKRLLMPLSEDGCVVNQVLAIQTFRYTSSSRSVVVVDNMDAFSGSDMAFIDAG